MQSGEKNSNQSLLFLSSHVPKARLHYTHNTQMPIKSLFNKYLRELSPPPPPGPYSLDIDGPYSLGSWVRGEKGGGGGGGGDDRIPYGPSDRNAYDTGL